MTLSENLNQSNECDVDIYGAILIFEYTGICTKDINVHLVTGQHNTILSENLNQSNVMWINMEQF